MGWKVPAWHNKHDSPPDPGRQESVQFFSWVLPGGDRRPWQRNKALEGNQSIIDTALCYYLTSSHDRQASTDTAPVVEE